MVLPCYDPKHPGNGIRHRSGKTCIHPGCGAPAGTLWSPLWCFKHNVERMQRIDAQFQGIEKAFANYQATHR